VNTANIDNYVLPIENDDSYGNYISIYRSAGFPEPFVSNMVLDASEQFLYSAMFGETDSFYVAKIATSSLTIDT